MTPLQQMYLEKLRSAFENSAGDDELVHILSNMRQDLTAAEFQLIVKTLQNNRS